MGFECPHCNTAIKGAVSQATLEERIGAKNTEISGLKTALGEHKTKADGYDAIVADRDEWKRKHEALSTQTERSNSLRDIGVTDPKIREGFETMYRSAKADNPELGWSDWLNSEEGAKGHPLLSGHFKIDAGEGNGDGNGAAAGAGQGNGAGAAPPPTTGGLPDSGAGNPKPPPTTGKKMTKAQLQSYFQSAEFRGMNLEERKAKVDELEGAYKAGA